MTRSRPMAVLASSALLTLAVLSARPSTAEVDRPPKPGGVYKLKPGIFVAQNTSCKDPPNAAIKRYDGRGISTAHTRSCVATIISKRRSGYGSVHRVNQSCTDAGSGPGKRFVERPTIDVADALSFSIKSQDDTVYRYCQIDVQAVRRGKPTL